MKSAILLLVLVAGAALAGAPAFGQSDSLRMHTMRCFNRHRAPEDRAESCKNLMQTNINYADETDVAQADIDAGKFDDAIAMLASRLNAHPTDMPALALRSAAYAASSHYDLAMADADLLVRSYPSQEYAYYARCWSRAVANRDLNSAIADCDRAISINGGDPMLRDARGFVHFRLGNFKAAIADYDDAIARKGYNNQRAQFMVQVMDIDAANAMLSSEPSSLYMRGLSKQAMGDADGGAKDIEAAKKGDPYVADEYAALGVKP